MYGTGKSLSEALIFETTNPQYGDRLFIELQVQYMKIPSSNLGRTYYVQKLFLTFRTIFVHIMFFLCSANRRSSDKDLPVLKKKNLKQSLAYFAFDSIQIGIHETMQSKLSHFYLGSCHSPNQKM